MIATWDAKGFEGFKNFFFMYAQATSPEKTLLDGLDGFQARLPATGFAVGEWSNADSAVAPFLLRAELLLKNDLGAYPAGEGKKIYEALQGAQFARLRQYLKDVKEHPSIQATWDEVSRSQHAERLAMLIKYAVEGSPIRNLEPEPDV